MVCIYGFGLVVFLILLFKETTLLYGCLVCETGFLFGGEVMEYPQHIGQMVGATFDGKAKNVRVDKFTGGLESIETKHAAIHAGKAYYMDFYDTIGNGSVFYFYGKNTSDKYIHVQPPHFDGKMVDSGLDATFLIEFIEDAELTNLQEVVSLPSLNVNRGSTNQATFVVYPQSTQANTASQQIS